MSLQIVNSALIVANLLINRSQSKSIDKLESKLKFLEDDVSWLASNDSGKLVNEITKLRVKYENELASLNQQILQGNIFNQDVNHLIDDIKKESPEILDFIISNNVKLFDLVTMTNNNIIQLFQINEELALKIESVISSINVLAVKYGISIQDLSIRVDNHEKYIMVMSQKMLDIQSELNNRFIGVREDLKFIQSEVDRQLNDIGLVSSNTTAVLLSDGSLKVSDNLSLYPGRVFVGKVANVIESGSSTAWQNNLNVNAYNQNKAALIFDLNSSGAVSWKCNSAVFSQTVKIKNIIPIENDPGVLLDLSSDRDIIIPDISLEQPLFIVLKGGGLGEIDFSNLIPMFRPSVINVASISTKKRVNDSGSYCFGLVRSPFEIGEATVGTRGTIIIPVANVVSNYKQFLDVSIQSKSDTLVIIKVSKRTGWLSILSSSNEIGGHISGKCFPTLGETCPFINRPSDTYNNFNGSGQAYNVIPPANIIQSGDLILRMPASHLTFHGIEVLF